MRSFRDVVTRFRENWQGYVRTYRVLLVLAILSSLADMASTIYFMLLTVIILYTWAAWYNIWGHELYYPRLLRLLEHLAI